MSASRPSRDPKQDAEIKLRKAVAGRFGFVLGCIAAVAAFALNLYHTRGSYTTTSVAIAALMAALNVPLGIALGLLGEKLSRKRER